MKTGKIAYTYSLALGVEGCNSLSFIASPILPAIFNFPVMKA